MVQQLRAVLANTVGRLLADLIRRLLDKMSLPGKS